MTVVQLPVKSNVFVSLLVFSIKSALGKNLLGDVVDVVLNIDGLSVYYQSESLLLIQYVHLQTINVLHLTCLKQHNYLRIYYYVRNV